MEYRLWTLADQMRVKPISDNNIDKFTQLQLEVEYNDIVQYLGAEFYQELKRNLSNYTDLMNGGPYRDWETDRKSTRLNSSHRSLSRMPSSA